MSGTKKNQKVVELAKLTLFHCKKWDFIYLILHLKNVFLRFEKSGTLGELEESDETDLDAVKRIFPIK